MAREGSDNLKKEAGSCVKYAHPNKTSEVNFSAESNTGRVTETEIVAGHTDSEMNSDCYNSI